DADALADRVVVMGWHERQHARAGGKLQRVDEIRAAERLRGDFGTPRAVVVVDDVVRPYQQVDGRPGVRVHREVRRQFAELRDDASLRRCDTAQEYALPDEIRDEARARPVVQ